MANAINTDTVTVLHVRIEEGALLPEHSHYNEQVVNVIEGELELNVKGRLTSLFTAFSKNSSCTTDKRNDIEMVIRESVMKR